jgi:endonuclease/exonuclease/phosphatase family metal-dependent hydrolase
MLKVFRKYTKQFLITCNLLVSLCMLSLYILPYTDQSYFWFVNLFALAFPFLLLMQVGFLVFWLIAKPRVSALPILTLLLSFGLLRSVFGLHWQQKDSGHLKHSFRLATWNVHLFNFFENNGRLDRAMMQDAAKLGADVMVLQEFVFSLDSSSSMSLDTIRKRLGFKYAIAGNDRHFGVHTNAGSKKERYFPFCVALFSNHPILQWKRIQTLQEYNHTFIWADILLGKDTVRFMNVHLQSMHFVSGDYNFIENIDRQDVDNVKRAGMNILRKMRVANWLRALQVHVIKEEIEKSPHPVVLSGDFNDVPNSYAYQTVSKNLKDAFIDKGWGFGRSFRFLSPTLRIDHIFYNPLLSLEHLRVHHISKSDHYPLTADFNVQEK